MFGLSNARALASLSLFTVLVCLVAGCAAAPPSPTVNVATPPPGQVSVAPAATEAAIDLTGQWDGTLKVAGQEIPMSVRFQGSGAGLKALLDIPAQGQKDIPLGNVSYGHPAVHWEAFSGARLARYDGQVKPDGSIAGEFQQAGFKGTLVLNPVSVPPTAVPPYRQEEVTFKNGDTTLTGTLTLPPTGGPFPAVVLISGSGAQNRDEDLLGFQIFREIADYFTRNGIAVLRYDDRGVGGSTGSVSDSTTEDMAGDVLAGVSLLRSRPDINPKQIGLLGHSEGGIVAPIAAGRSDNVSFIILMSGTGLPGHQILLQQLADIQRANGVPQAEVDKSIALQTRIIDAVQTGQGMDAVKADLRPQFRAQIEALPKEQRKALGDVDKATEEAINGQLATMNTPWYKFFLTYDPAPALEKVQVPVLALFGGKDLQVAPGPNEAALVAALKKGGNTQFATKVFPEANHLYQRAVTGSPKEYGTLPPEFVPDFLPYVTDWIKQTVK